MTTFDIFDISALLGEVNKHNMAVLADDLQPHNDFLFNIIKEEVAAKHDDIMKAFKTKIRETRGKVTKVSVPLWTYKTRFYKKPWDVYKAELNEMLLDERNEKRRQEFEYDRVCTLNGWHWKIGVAYKDAPIAWGEDAGAFHPEAWSVNPMPVNLVVSKTDLMARLSTLFAPFVWVERAYGRVIHETRDYEIREMVLQATLYPRGLLADKKASLEKMYEKYPHNYAQAYVLAEDEEVVLNGPDREPPRTPPVTPSPAPQEPPAIQRPCPVDGVCTRTECACPYPPRRYSHDYTTRYYDGWV